MSTSCHLEMLRTLTPAESNALRLDLSVDRSLRATHFLMEQDVVKVMACALRVNVR